MEKRRDSASWIIGAATFVVATSLIGVTAGPGFGTPSSKAQSSRARPDSPLAGNVGVSVVPGPLAISVDLTPLVLERQPGDGHSTRYRGRLPLVRVVDTRSTLVGWEAYVRIWAPETPSTDGSRLFVRPGRPEVASGQRRGVHASRPVWTELGDPVSLFAAEPGWGAGANDVDAFVELVLPYESSIPEITIPFDVSVF